MYWWPQNAAPWFWCLEKCHHSRLLLLTMLFWKPLKALRLCLRMQAVNCQGDILGMHANSSHILSQTQHLATVFAGGKPSHQKPTGSDGICFGCHLHYREVSLQILLPLAKCIHKCLLEVTEKLFLQVTTITCMKELFVFFNHPLLVNSHVESSFLLCTVPDWW